MRFHLLLPPLILAAFLSFSAGDARAGSFFGPVCYGARYTDRYPNRSHNVFGCGPCCHCRAWHGFCRHRIIRQYPSAPNEAMPTGAMPATAAPVQPPF
jgi:hypothetical protein